ncbi:hypothetical protein EV421DRAFT_1936605 [Armillaria borealis]|uniref:Uncharacterized protein n=1 Tax=Armillaria borealis TaxID=47425 RepID=A0AA39JN11_9AGAR|nr:hypothetical protein EV421DRAFT_1936605 [Armillaria borealis]
MTAPNFYRPSFPGTVSPHTQEEYYLFHVSDSFSSPSTMHPGHRRDCSLSLSMVRRTFVALIGSASSQLSCVDCGHGIHTHVDYESKVVYHNPSTHCAAYAQEAHNSQACTCTVQLIDHEPTVNAYRSIALSHSPAFIVSSPNSIAPSNDNITGPSGNTGTLVITLTPTPSIDVNPSSGPNSVLFTPVPITFHSNSVLHFSQSDVYTSVYQQQSDDASLVHDLAGGPAVHHAPEDYYDYQGHLSKMDGAPSADPYA